MFFSLLFFIFTVSLPLFAESKIAGDLALEHRYFFSEDSPNHSHQNAHTLYGTLFYSHHWDDENKIIRLSPFASLSSPDDERNRFDLREVSFLGIWGDWEVFLGMGKTFWGSVESVHLVDTLNQTDFIQSPQGEEKLGQPQVRLSYLSPWGEFSFFALPYFRKRTFPGSAGRLNTPLSINDTALYASGAQQWNFDYAFSWTHSWGDLDFTLHWFEGTERDPVLLLRGQQLFAYYRQSFQAGLNLSYVYQDAIFKAEVLYRNPTQIKEFWALATGVEYTFYNLKDSGLDLGVLLEAIYDERGALSPQGLYRHAFIGIRLNLNNSYDMSFLLAHYYNWKEQRHTQTALEAQGRIYKNWTWELEIALFYPQKDLSFRDYLRNDDFIEATLSYSF